MATTNLLVEWRGQAVVQFQEPGRRTGNTDGSGLRRSQRWTVGGAEHTMERTEHRSVRRARRMWCFTCMCGWAANTTTATGLTNRPAVVHLRAMRRQRG